MNKHLLLALLFIPLVAGCDDFHDFCSEPCPPDHTFDDIFGVFDVSNDAFDVSFDGSDVSGPETAPQ